MGQYDAKYLWWKLEDTQIIFFLGTYKVVFQVISSEVIIDIFFLLLLVYSETNFD
jgi:hypothetical protein